MRVDGLTEVAGEVLYPWETPFDPVAPPGKAVGFSVSDILAVTGNVRRDHPESPQAEIEVVSEGMRCRGLQDQQERPIVPRWLDQEAAP
jgi:hypothetical protein